MVVPADALMPRGTTDQFSAMGFFTDGNSQDITGSVAWVSSQPSVMSISPAGLAAAVTTGNTTITAALGPVSGSLAVSVTLPLPRFAYVANRNDSTISIYAVDYLSGQMRANGYVPTGGSFAFSVAVDPMGKFAYVANSNSNNISAFTINASNGALTVVPGSPFAGGSQPDSIAVDPTGKFAYVANNRSNDVSAFAIDPSTGALTTASGSPFAAGYGPRSVTVDPSAQFADVANDLTRNVSAFTINPSTGALTAVSGSPFGKRPCFGDHNGQNSVAFLPGPYYLLHADGTTIGPVTSITLRGTEAAILMKAPVVPPLPYSPPVL